MRIAVVGLGIAGTTLACLLADADHEVVVLECATDPRPLGAGIWLQHLGQQVLDRLGLLEPLRARSRDVTRVDVRTSTGRRLLDLGYGDVPGEVPALGVHRGALFSLLFDEVRRRRVPLELGVEVTGVRPAAGGLVVETAAGDHGTFDLVVGCDGSRSPVRHSMGVTVRDRPYAYGALWSIVDDPDGLAGDRLYQCLRGTREYFGVLPTGMGQASVFWSVRSPDAVAASADLDAWRARARPLAGPMADLVDRIDHLLPASYRDVVVRRPYRLTDGSGLAGSPHAAAAVLVGDAAHAMSPQLGTGTSLALADAWGLHHALATHAHGPADLETALTAYAASRAAHVRWYQWWTRLMMPVFQSSLTPLAWPRDTLSPWLTRVPGITPQLVTTLTGDRVSPWSRCPLPEAPGRP